MINYLHYIYCLVNNLISVYSENHVKDYPIALQYFKPKKIYDLCDFDVYPVNRSNTLKR